MSFFPGPQARANNVTDKKRREKQKKRPMAAPKFACCLVCFLTVFADIVLSVPLTMGPTPKRTDFSSMDRASPSFMFVLCARDNWNWFARRLGRAQLAERCSTATNVIDGALVKN